jgi:hypothetical protein
VPVASPAQPSMPVTSDPAVESFPVTDVDILFSSGQKYACTVKDGVDGLAVSDAVVVVDFASPVEHCEIARVHVAMITLRQRVQTRRLPSPGVGASAKGHGR